MPNDIKCDVFGEGEIVLLLHGWGQCKEMMIPLIEELKDKYKCVVMDLPGFGESSFNNVNNLDDYVSKIREFLENKKLLPKYIIGHSFGGKLAFSYYLKYNDLEKLIIIASPILKPKRSIKYYIKVLSYKLKKKLLKGEVKGGSKDYINCKDDMKPLFINTVNTHYNKEIKRINIPTLLIWGKDDKVVPLSKAKKIERLCKTSRLYIIKGEHFAYLDNVCYTKLIIQKFIREG